MWWSRLECICICICNSVLSSLSLCLFLNICIGLQPSMPVQALFPTPTIACSQTLSAIFCDCPISSSPIATPTTTPTPSDRTPPVLTFVRNPLSSNQDITITWIFNKPVNAHCTLLSPSYVALPFPCSTSFSITNLMAGEYTLFIYAIDLVGSYVLEVSHSWIVGKISTPSKFSLCNLW